MIDPVELTARENLTDLQVYPVLMNQSCTIFAIYTTIFSSCIDYIWELLKQSGPITFLIFSRLIPLIKIE